MKIVRPAIFYIGSIVIALGIAVAILQLGSSLPANTASSADSALASSDMGSTGAMMWQNLQANVGQPLSHLFVQLLVVIMACRVVSKLFVRIGLPAVVGEMFAGILLGPSLLGLLAPDAFNFVFPASSLETLQLLSQIGICIFMFIVGMELNVGHLRGKAATAVAVSHVSIVLPFLLGMGLAYFLFADMAGPNASFAGFALFMGISMSVTAFPVLVRILQERKLSRTVLGTTAITCAAVGDMTAWSIMAFVVAIANAGTLASAGITVLLALAFTATMILAVRRVLPVWIGTAQLRSEETSRGTLIIVFCILISSALSTEVIGIHALFGAFLAGAVMPNVNEFRRGISASMEKFSTVLLLPLFFAFTGLRTEIGLLEGVNDWILCFVIILVATVGKLGGSAIAARVTGMNWRESLQLGALMNTRGLMELIALNIGYDLGVLSPRIFTMLVIMAIITTTMTGPLLTLLGTREPSHDRDHQLSGA